MECAGFVHRSTIVPEDHVGRVAHFQRKRIGRFQNWETVRPIRRTQMDLSILFLHRQGLAFGGKQEHRSGALDGKAAQTGSP